MDKKKKERNIIECFAKELGIDIEILSCSDARKVFSKYNGENPDFVILYKEDYIGVELFELTRDFSPGVYNKTGNKNFPHLISKKKNKLEITGLTQLDDLGDILQELTEKKLKKINNYVTSRIWFIVYADQYHNIESLSAAREDGVLDKISNYIISKYDKLKMVDKFFIFDRINNFIHVIK